MSIRTFNGITPSVAAGAYIDETALIVGDVKIGADSSVWPMTVIRGDVNTIRIGSRSNIQDGSVLHVTHAYKAVPEGFALEIGDNVTVGHKVILHGCNIAENCLIGMGATVMDGAVVQPYTMIGAGSLVSPGKKLEGGYLWIGVPARRARELTTAEHDWIDYSAGHYVELKNRHR